MRHVARLLVAALLVPALLLGFVPAAAAAPNGVWILGEKTGSNVSGWEYADYAFPEPDCAIRARWTGYTGLGDASVNLEVEGKCEWVFTPHVSEVIFEGPSSCSITVPVTSEETSSWWDPSDETSFSGSLSTFTGCAIDRWTAVIPKNNLPDAEVYGDIALGDVSDSDTDGDCLVDVKYFSGGPILNPPGSSNVYFKMEMTVYSPIVQTIYTRAAIRIYKPDGNQATYPSSGLGGVKTIPLEIGLNTVTVADFDTFYDIPADLASLDEISFANVSRDWPATNGNLVTVRKVSATSPGAEDDGLATTHWTSDTSDPTRKSCTYHFGRGLWNAGGLDEMPGGGGDEELPEDLDSESDEGAEPPLEAGCSFSLTDPTTWASGGICALVYLMKKAVGLLRKILAAIANGVGGAVNLAWDGLAALWVPEDGYVDAKFDDVRSDWDASGPGEWGGAVGDTVTAVGDLGSSAGGCDGPTVAGEVGGIGYSLDPLDSCEAPMSGVALTVKTLLTLFLVVGGVFAAARPLMAAFGMNAPTPGQSS